VRGWCWPAAATALYYSAVVVRPHQFFCPDTKYCKLIHTYMYVVSESTSVVEFERAMMRR